jgi:hypothetical protein
VRPYELPDGSVIEPTHNLLTSIPEAIFNPAEWLGMSEALSGPAMIVKSIESCAIDLRLDLFNSIVLSGGNTLFPGLAKRLEYHRYVLIC